MTPVSTALPPAAFGSGGGGDGGAGGTGGGGGEGGFGGGEAKTKSLAGESEEVSVAAEDVIMLEVGVGGMVVFGLVLFLGDFGFEVLLILQGMSCGGCSASVKRILESQVSHFFTDCFLV